MSNLFHKILCDFSERVKVQTSGYKDIFQHGHRERTLVQIDSDTGTISQGIVMYLKINFFIALL